ncbi:MAG: RNase adapter RapZ [Pseudoramibacter sp.]
MKTLIITGLSGAGKSKAVDILEDEGFYCVDNVPVHLVMTFIRLCRNGESEIERLAIVTDIRGVVSNPDYTATLNQFVQALPEDVEILFLEAKPQELVRRYQVSRRKHPLLDQANTLIGAIDMEQHIMKVLRDRANCVIDTTTLGINDLRKLIVNMLVADKKKAQVGVKVSSFGFKYGMPISADFVFDVRFLPNPYYKADLRQLTGQDEAVQQYVMKFPQSRAYFDKVLDLIKTVIPHYEEVNKKYVEIAFGCTGGRHRSVTFACLLSQALKEEKISVSLTHRDIDKDLR